MGKFTVENDFATPFGTTTSDGFHADADAIRFEPDVKTAIDGKDADGRHASVETALKKRAKSVTVNGTQYTVNFETGDVNLGTIDVASAISGITVQSGTTTGTSVTNKNATITLAPVTLNYEATTGNLTLVDEFGVTGKTIALGLDKFVKSGVYVAESKKIILYFDDTKKDYIEIPVADLVNEYSGDGKTIEYVGGTQTAFTLVASAKTALSNVAVNTTNISTVSGKVNTNTTNIGTVSGNLNTVSGKVNTNTTNIGTVSGNLNTVSGKVNTNTTNIGTVSGNLNTVSGKVNTNTTNIGTISGDLSTVKSKYLSGVSVNTSAMTVSNHIATINLTQTISSGTTATGQIPSVKSVWDYVQPLSTAQKTTLDNMFTIPTT